MRLTGQSIHPVANSNPYTGPVIPTAWDPNWPKYTNLGDPPYGPATIQAFQAFPQDLLIYCIVRHGYYLTIIAPSVTVQQAPALISALATEAQNTINGIAAIPPTITTRTQIDAALAAQVDAALAAVPTGVSGPSI